MSKNTIYIDGAICSIDGQDLNLDEVVSDMIEYFSERGLVFGGGIDYSKF